MESKGQQTILCAFYLRSYSLTVITQARGPRSCILDALAERVRVCCLHELRFVRVCARDMGVRRMHVLDGRAHSKPIGVGEAYVERVS